MPQRSNSPLAVPAANPVRDLDFRPLIHRERLLYPHFALRQSKLTFYLRLKVHLALPRVKLTGSTSPRGKSHEPSLTRRIKAGFADRIVSRLGVTPDRPGRPTVNLLQCRDEGTILISLPLL